MVMLRAGQTLTSEQLLAHLDDAGLSKYDMPEFVLMLGDIPLTANGKIRKIDIVADIENGRLAPQPVRFEQKRASA